MLIACTREDRGPELAPVPATPSAFDVEVGTGDTDFQPLAEGAEVDLIHGVQGGWHIWTGFRVRNAALQDVRVNLYSRFDDGTAAGDPSSVAVVLSARPSGEQTNCCMRNFIHDGIAARGRKIVLRVEIVAGDGRHGAGERMIVGR